MSELAPHASGELIQVPCPNCGRHLRAGRTGGPQDVTHHKPGSGDRGLCFRGVLVPDVHGEEHRLEEAPEGIRLQDFLREQRGEWDRRWALVMRTAIY